MLRDDSTLILCRDRSLMEIQRFPELFNTFPRALLDVDANSSASLFDAPPLRTLSAGPSGRLSHVSVDSKVVDYEFDRVIHCCVQLVKGDCPCRSLHHFPLMI